MNNKWYVHSKKSSTEVEMNKFIATYMPTDEARCRRKYPGRSHWHTNLKHIKNPAYTLLKNIYTNSKIITKCMEMKNTKFSKINFIWGKKMWSQIQTIGNAYFLRQFLSALICIPFCKSEMYPIYSKAKPSFPWVSSSGLTGMGRSREQAAAIPRATYSPGHEFPIHRFQNLLTGLGRQECTEGSWCMWTRRGTMLSSSWTMGGWEIPNDEMCMWVTSDSQRLDLKTVSGTGPLVPRSEWGLHENAADPKWEKSGLG